MVAEVGEPVLGFRIYNPHVGTPTHPITEFSRSELQWIGNSMYLISHLRYVFTVLATVTQLDLALLIVMFKELTSLFTVRHLLIYKTFVQYDDADADQTAARRSARSTRVSFRHAEDTSNTTTKDASSDEDDEAAVDLEYGTPHSFRMCSAQRML